MSQEKKEPQEQKKESKDKYNNLIVNEKFGNRLMSLSLKEGVYKKPTGEESPFKTMIITSSSCTQEGSPITEKQELANGQYADVVKSQSIHIPVQSFKEFISKVNEVLKKEE